MPRLSSSAFALALGLAFTLAAPARARESSGTPAAKAFFAQGDAAAKAGKLPDAIAAFKKAIDADPDYVDAHQRFIEVSQRAEMPNTRTPSVPRLTELYAKLAKQQPKRAVYRWALGFLATDSDKGDAHFRAALKLDPSFGRAHLLLARNADLRGDWTAQREHLKAAVDSNPGEPRYLMKYAQAFKRSDPARFRELASSVVDKFPESQTAAEALWHIADTVTGAERRVIYERLRANYPADRFSYGASAMYDFYDDVTSPSDALSIAEYMAKVMPASKSWARRVELQQAMVRATALVAERKFDDALAVIEKTERPSGNHGTTWALLKAEVAAGAGHSDQAYASLLESAAASPDDRVQGPLLKYAATLNKSARDIDADIWRVRDAKASAAPPFELQADRRDKPVKLSDYQGRVVLVAFWFPG